MRIGNWTYFFKQAVLNIINNRFIQIVSMGTITISIILLGLFLLLSVNINTWVQAWGDSLSMSVYLDDGINQKTKNRVREVLIRLPGAEFIGYISKEKAMEQLTDILGTQAGLLDGLKSNPLPASFEIVFRDKKRRPPAPQKIKDTLEEIEGVEEVQYSEQWVKRFEGILSIMKLAGFFIGGLVCIAVLFIITNTIKLNIYSRREEIEIFKLVGATDWFIKIPFLIEGALQGFLSGLSAILILFLGYSTFSFKTVRLFDLPVLDMVFLPGMYAVFLISLGLILGLLGGFIAIGRFVKL